MLLDEGEAASGSAGGLGQSPSLTRKSSAAVGQGQEGCSRGGGGCAQVEKSHKVSATVGSD